LVGLFPPWQDKPRDEFQRLGAVEEPVGRHAWWSPPKAERWHFVYVNHSRLLIELTVVALVTSGLLVTLRPRS
jgi:hypothetical protein